MSNSELMLAIAILSNRSARLLKVEDLTVGEVVIEDISAWIFMFALCQKPGLFIKGILRGQVFNCLASSSKASPAKTIDTAPMVFQ